MPFKKGEPSCRKLEPTPQQRRQVLTMTGFGIRQSEIAAVLSIDEKTLRRHFRRELDTGATEANMRVAQSLYDMAVRDRIPAAAIWWTKARMGWKSDQDLTINGTQTIQMQHLLAAQAVSDALHNAPHTLPAEIEGTVDSEDEVEELQDLMTPALE
jgi:hypothetical protein